MSSIFSGPLLELPAASSSARQYFESMPLGTDPNYVMVFNDFRKADDYNTTNFTLTTVDGGTDAAQVNAVQTGLANGIFKMQTNDASADSNSIQDKVEVWEFVSGKKVWFEAKAQLSAPATTTFLLGFAITDTTPKDATDSIQFKIASGDASILCQTTKNSTVTSVDSQIDAVANTYNTFGIYWDGSTTVKFYIDRVLVSSHTTNICDDEQLALTMHLETGSAAVKAALIDYIWCVKER